MEGLSTLYYECHRCKGTGIADTQKGTEDPCSLCNGSKYLPFAFVDLADMKDKINDILNKINDIFEKLNE